MNLSRAQLRAQYERARPLLGELVDDAEKAFQLPPRIMWAIYSRETNLDPHWITNPGDSGHGHGLKAKIGQVDDRSHPIPDDWRTNLAWQVGTSAQIFANGYRRTGGDIVRAANRYNSGQEQTRYTTGKDYGPDVYERWQALVEMFPPTPPEEEFKIVLALMNTDGFVIDIEAASKDNGARPLQFPANGQENQGIFFEGIHGERYGPNDVEGKIVRIGFDHSGKYLDAPPDDGTHPPELVHQWDKAADASWQLWRVERAPNTGQGWQPVGYRIVNDHTGMVLDVEGISLEPGARIIQWPWNGQSNQQWILARFR